VTAREYAQACGWLYDAVKNAEVRHLGAARARRGGSGCPDAGPGRRVRLGPPQARLSDITPLVAVTLACWGFRTYGGDSGGVGLVRLRDIEGLLALLLIVAGVALISIPFALIVAGFLLVIDRMTS
jgi:hypothetical protein